MATNGCLNDSNFGPVSTCRFFDFTFTFSNTILSIAPTSLALLVLVFRLWKVATKPRIKDRLNEKFSQDWLGLARIGLSSLYMVLCLALLALAASDSTLKHDLEAKTIIPALALSFATSVVMIPLSYNERIRTRGGSFVLPFWLFSSILLDASRARSYTLISSIHRTSWFGLFIASLVVKGGMLAVESSNGVKTHSSKESRASFFSTILFLWLVPLIFTGYRRPLVAKDLEDLKRDYEAKSSFNTLSNALYGPEQESSPQALVSRSETFSSTRKGDALELDDLPTHHPASEPQHFHQSSPTSKKPQRPLMVATLFAFPIQIIVRPVAWRLLFTAASLCQPFLVSRTLSFAQSFAGTNDKQPPAFGYGLIGATALVYTVLGISTGMFFWTVSQSEVIIRGSFVSLIWEKAMRIDQVAASSSEFSPSQLMSVDLERIIKVFQSFHILWSGILTLIIGSYILYTQLGLVFLAPLVTIMLTIALTPLFSMGLGDKQSGWSTASDRRIGLIASALTHIKALKLSAYEGAITEQLVEARKDEASKMARFYNQFVVIILETNLLVEVLTVVTFGFLAYLKPERFTVNTVFTSLTLIGIVQEPLLIIGQQWASIITAMSSVRRIEAFLNQEESPTIESDSLSSRANVEKSQLRDLSVAVAFKDATLSYRSSEILSDVTLSIPSNSLTIVCGQVSSGKSTLLNACLGELHVSKGSLNRDLGKVEYVSQEIWLQESLTIQENIVFASAFDESHYRMILKATALDVDLSELDLGDRTIASRLSGGQRARVGLARALYSRPDTLVIDDVLTSLDATTAASIWESLFGHSGLLLSKTVVMSTNSLHLLPHAALVIRLEGGKVAESGRFSDLSIRGKSAISSSIPKKDEQIEKNQVKAVELSTELKKQDTEQEEEVTGSVGLKTYGKWIKAQGIALFIWLLVGAATNAASGIGLQLLVQAWSSANEMELGKNREAFTVGSVLLALSTGGFGGAAFWMFLGPMTQNAGRSLHREQLDGLMKTSVSYFESGSTGHILNNFSQILFLIDFELPLAALNFIFNIFYLLAQTIVIVIPAPYLLIVFFFIAFIYIALQRLYIPSSRALRRLELNSKSPLYSTFSECTTVQGLTTIRASRSELKFGSQNYELINASQRPFYYLWAARRWLLTSLNLLGGVINVFLVLIVVLLRNSSSVGVLGVSLLSASQIGGMLNRVMIAYSEMEIGAVAIERIQRMSNLEPEEAEGLNKRKLEASKIQGEIRMENLTVKYRPELDPSLKNFNVSIRAGTRVGICGRSGSGKSTLLLALFKMLLPQEGRITIDGEDIAELNVESLRSSMTIISQVPLLLDTSVRRNLDPEGTIEDQDLWHALSLCQLTAFVKSLPDQLETVLSGKVYATPGQKQLLALARAILRKRKILILDESSSALDEATDLAMQQVMDTAFKNTTILAVAHRIQTIRNYDQILVMSNGALIENGTPSELLAQDSVFKSLAIEQRCA